MSSGFSTVMAETRKHYSKAFKHLKKDNYYLRILYIVKIAIEGWAQ